MLKAAIEQRASAKLVYVAIGISLISLIVSIISYFI